MKGKIAEFSNMIFGVVIFLAFLSIPVLLILGSTWAAKNLLQPLIVLGWIAIAIDILILLPLSIFKGLRSYTGTAIFISSFIFGLVTWLLGFILTYAIWGLWAVVAGVLLFGGAVVPFALLATLFNGMWEPFFTVLILAALTFGSRIIGMLIAERG
jgi:O-antigen/teichoic acid export membrane protein